MEESSRLEAAAPRGEVRVGTIVPVLTNHKLGRTVCNFANFGRTNMI